MKTAFVYVFFASLMASTGAFAPLATRAVGKPKVEKKGKAKAAPAPPAKKPSFFDGLAKKAASVAPKKEAEEPVKKGKAAKKAAPAKKVVKKVVKKAPVKKVVKKAPVKKVVKKAPVKKSAKKVVARKAGPRTSSGYPSFRASTEAFKPFKGISGGGNKAPLDKIKVPDLSDPKLQKVRDPKFYAAAAAQRKQNLYGAENGFVYDDGLTVLERRQKGSLDTFLTGSAKSQADTSTIRSDIEAEPLLFGLDPDRFQLLFIAIFGLFTLVGCLSGTIQL